MHWSTQINIDCIWVRHYKPKIAQLIIHSVTTLLNVMEFDALTMLECLHCSRCLLRSMLCCKAFCLLPDGEDSIHPYRCINLYPFIVVFHPTFL